GRPEPRERALEEDLLLLALEAEEGPGRLEELRLGRRRALGLERLQELVGHVAFPDRLAPGVGARDVAALEREPQPALDRLAPERGPRAQRSRVVGGAEA